MLSLRIRQLTLFTAALLGTTFSLQAGFSIAKSGKARCVVLSQPGATEPEQSALRELTNTLRQITGAEFQVSDTQPKSVSRAIIVGPGPVAEREFPEINFAALAPLRLCVKFPHPSSPLCALRAFATWRLCVNCPIHHPLPH